MSIRTNSKHEEAEAEGNTELVLSVVTYTGERSMFGPETLRSQGDYPALDSFQRDDPKVVMLPTQRLGWWETNENFEVSYKPEDVAKAFLGANYLPVQLIGPAYDPKLRDRVCESLGIEAAATEEGWREALREVAGVDEEDDEVEGPQSTKREDDLAQKDRSVLIKVAGSYGDEELEDAKDEAGVSSVSHLPNTALAAYLAAKDDDEVARRIETAKQGGEL